MSLLRELLSQAISLKASDVHLKAGQRPVLRVAGSLFQTEHDVISREDIAKIVENILPEHLQQRYMIEHEVDFSLQEPDVGRFRVNVFHSHGCPAVAMRHVKTRIPTFEELNLLPVLQDLALTPRGIIIAAGTTGSGKSTTLAALIQHINTHDARRIITVEDPIEYLFTDNQCIISQREVGVDTLSFHSALKHVLRQDPDVIMIGEMRDAESFIAALQASETGHLIFSTVHTDTASQSVQRILNFFPAGEREQVRLSLANNLRSVICQRLVPSIDGGVVPAVELMINTPTVRKLLEKNLLEKLPAAIETGSEEAMQTFNQAIYTLIKNGVITEEEGLTRCGNPETLKMNLKGIFLDEAHRILST
jgi:twitching motility protein PilT